MRADFPSLLVYWGALAATLVFYREYRRYSDDNKVIGVCLFLSLGLPFAILAGCRNGVGTDYGNYVKMFENIIAQPWSDFFSSWAITDYGFKLLIKVASFISPSNRFLFGVTGYGTAEVAFLAFYRLRDKLDMRLSIVLYYLLAYHPSLNIIRQMMAVSFVLLVTAYLLKGNYFGAILAAVGATLIHSTAIVSVAFIIIRWIFSRSRIRIRGEKAYQTNYKWALYYGLFIIFGTLLAPVVLQLVIVIPGLNKYAKYFETEPKLGIGTVCSFIALVLPLLICFGKKIMKDMDLMLFLSSFMLYLPISILGYYASWASRLNIFIICMLIIYFPIMVRKLKPLEKQNRKERLLCGYYFAFIALKYCYEILFMNYHATFPYFR